jgi:hypothetical protein
MDLGKIIHMSKHPKREKSKIFFLAKKKEKRRRKPEVMVVRRTIKN